jgi:thiol-disulfide isomerase/thioredoxin
LSTPQLAPEWRTTDWLNTPRPLGLQQLRGKVVLLHAFQMLCPGCVARGIPQAQRVADAFAGAPLVVVGMHTVFEHHDAMQLASLRAFLHEYRVRFPVGVDAPDPDGGRIPQTMRAYAMQGTPTTILIDAQGRLRRQVFGVHEDLLLGAELQTLLLEAESNRLEPSKPEAGDVGCDEAGCRVSPSAFAR